MAESSPRDPVAARLSADRIVDAAIAQMRAHGYDAVTMRSIAHVARVWDQWRIPAADPARWRDQLVESLVRLRELYRASPGVARCTTRMVPLDPDLLPAAGRLRAIVRSGGVADEHAAWFVDVAVLHVAAMADTAVAASADERSRFGVDLLVDGLEGLGRAS